MKLMLVMLWMLPVMAFAQQGTGNGGHALVRKDPAPDQQRVRLLDYGLTENKIPVNFGPEADTIAKKVAVGVKRLSRLSQNFSKSVEDYAKPLIEAIGQGGIGLHNTDMVVFTHDNLPFIPDAKNLTYPKGTEPAQLAVRVKKGEYPELGTAEFVIQIELFNDLSMDDQAGLVLHEAIYRYLKTAFYHPDSRYARLINQNVAGVAIETATEEELLKILELATLPTQVSFTSEQSDAVDVDVIVGAKACHITATQNQDSRQVVGFVDEGGAAIKLSTCVFRLLPSKVSYSVAMTGTARKTQVKYWVFTQRDLNADFRKLLQQMWFWSWKEMPMVKPRIHGVFNIEIRSKKGPYANSGEADFDFPYSNK